MDFLRAGPCNTPWIDKVVLAAAKYQRKLNRDEALKECVRDGKVVVLTTRRKPR